MSYVDAVVATVCCVLFAAAAFLVRRRLRSVGAVSPRPGPRPREEDLVRPALDPAGNPVWATQDELPWPDLATLTPSGPPRSAISEPDRGEVAS
jgi:hypothetical protein